MTGIKVVELGVWIAGPAAGGILADWGADVIKIEPPGGDPCRMFQAMLGDVLPNNPIFELDNRSKQSIAIDLSQADGVAVAKELLADADVFITNVRPGGLERMGLDYESLRVEFPRLVYCHITGYGLEGEDVNRPAFDIAAFWSRSGIAHMLSGEDGEPPFQRGGMGDHNAGLAGAGAISAALFERERSGEGQLVSTSLFREGMYTIGFDLNTMLMWGAPIALGSRHTGNPAMNNYVAGDGRRFWLTGIDGRRHWPPLCRVLGKDEWLTDPRFAEPLDRHANAVELVGLVDEVFATKSLDEWSEIFTTEPDIFWAPINSLEDLVADQQAWDAGGFVDVPDEPGSTVTTTMVATPVDFSRTTWEPRSTAPDLGEHTNDVLTALGKTPDQITALRESGTVR